MSVPGENLELRKFEICHIIFWFNVFSISENTRSKVLFPLLLKVKNIFLSFFSIR
jgi:hypothetical protein